ncbi:MAG: hypothetical protein ACFFCW_48705 [Candidatus Hodarchaeota archaeon]
MIKNNLFSIQHITYVRKDLFNLLMYSIYSSINELFGKKGWGIVWRTGEIAFAELKKQGRITEKDPILLAQKIAKYLEEGGYGSRFVVHKMKENEFIYEIHDAAARPSVLRVKKKYGDDAVLAHFATAIMFAALKDMCNMKAEISHLEVAPTEIGVTKEKWVLSKIGNSNEGK